MSKPGESQHLFDKPRNVSLVTRGLHIACLLLILLEFILHRHAEREWESVTAFYALFGFTACVTIVLAAKQLRKILKRRTDYYDVDD